MSINIRHFNSHRGQNRLDGKHSWNIYDSKQSDDAEAVAEIVTGPRGSPVCEPVDAPTPLSPLGTWRDHHWGPIIPMMCTGRNPCGPSGGRSRASLSRRSIRSPVGRCRGRPRSRLWGRSGCPACLCSRLGTTPCSTPPARGMTGCSVRTPRSRSPPWFHLDPFHRHRCCHRHPEIFLAIGSVDPRNAGIPLVPRLFLTVVDGEHSDMNMGSAGWLMLIVFSNGGPGPV